MTDFVDPNKRIEELLVQALDKPRQTLGVLHQIGATVLAVLLGAFSLWFFIEDSIDQKVANHAQYRHPQAYSAEMAQARTANVDRRLQVLEEHIQNLDRHHTHSTPQGYHWAPNDSDPAYVYLGEE